MPKDSLDAEKLVKPYLSESNFLGWSVLFTNPSTGEIVYDGQAYIWDLNLPFQFYPDNPRVMNCLMIANWGAMQQGGGYAPLPQPGGDLAQEILPDSRLFTWPYPAGMDPLPETPPPCDNLIAGTTWLRGAIITGIGDGDVVPVYAFPVYNGPVMRWIGLYEKLDYGFYLDKDWTMLYNPLWVENSGIGFVDANVTAFPGSEE